MSVSLITIASHRYEGVWLKAGDPFEAANETDASELCCLGFAQRPATPQSRDVTNYENRMLTAETAAEPRQKRQYIRRNLAAQ